MEYTTDRESLMRLGIILATFDLPSDLLTIIRNFLVKLATPMEQILLNMSVKRNPLSSISYFLINKFPCKETIIIIIDRGTWPYTCKNCNVRKDWSNGTCYFYCENHMPVLLYKCTKCAIQSFKPLSLISNDYCAHIQPYIEYYYGVAQPKPIEQCETG